MIIPGKKKITYREVIDELEAIADAKIAAHSARFFKTGPGEYGEGDKFLGIRVPRQREISKKFRQLELAHISELLHSPYHEVRLTGIFILVSKYQMCNNVEGRKTIFDFYIKHLNCVNNWDLVDSSAKYIAGHFLYEYEKDRSILYELSDSEDLWKRRTAIMATFYFVNKGDFDTTLQLSNKYLCDSEDLIHKASGWMLREIGKQKEDILRKFLDNHYKKMPRTMLRYAIEKLDEGIRQTYLKGKV